MYTILMNSEDKSLIATKRTKLYQRESLVDKIQFLIPSIYEDIDLSNDSYQIILKYTDQGNVAHADILTKDEELYKENYIRCTLPVDIELTKFSGNITLYISIIGVNTDDQVESEILHTGGISIEISPLDDIFGFEPDKSFQKLDQRILELQAIAKANNLLAESIDKNKADDISYEDNTLTLMSNGKKIGTSHVLDQQSEFDVVDFDKSSEDPSPDDEDTYIEF